MSNKVWILNGTWTFAMSKSTEFLLLMPPEDVLTLAAVRFFERSLGVTVEEFHDAAHKAAREAQKVEGNDSMLHTQEIFTPAFAPNSVTVHLPGSRRTMHLPIVADRRPPERLLDFTTSNLMFPSPYGGPAKRYEQVPWPVKEFFGAEFFGEYLDELNQVTVMRQTELRCQYSDSYIRAAFEREWDALGTHGYHHLTFYRFS